MKEKLSARLKSSKKSTKSSFVFDLPVTYNYKVSAWIQYYQTSGSKSFKEWLRRSTKYVPYIQNQLKKAGLPQDLVYMAMIESGFSSHAKSTADAVGPWQFIQATGERYGLKVDWWIDERRDFKKSTQAAIRYINDLYEEFGSWYLVAASYNMGEGGLARVIKKHGSNDFWVLTKKNALPSETTEYVPKIIAAMLISKAPNLYGFRDLDLQIPLEYDMVVAPGGIHLDDVADYLGVTHKSMRELNPELILGYIPDKIRAHQVRVPKGSQTWATKYFSSFTRPSVATEAKL